MTWTLNYGARGSSRSVDNLGVVGAKPGVALSNLAYLPNYQDLKK